MIRESAVSLCDHLLLILNSSSSSCSLLCHHESDCNHCDEKPLFLSLLLSPFSSSLFYLFSQSPSPPLLHPIPDSPSSKMCDSSLGCRHHRRPVRVYSLFRRMRFAKDRTGVKEEMEIKNLELFMENQSIIEENERLRKKAFLLHKENQVLLSQLQIFSKRKSQTNSDLSD